MSNCSNHSKSLFGETDMKVVAAKIANLNYETLEDLLFYLSLRIKDDSYRDKEKGRHKLSQTLYFASDHLKIVSVYIKEAWKISKPFMEGKDEK